MKEIQNNQWIAHYRTDQPHFGLERMVELLALRGNPHLKLKVIHIGGTNGKGSTIAFLKKMLEKMGLKVGVFSSPYLIHYTDQISINGESIPEARLESLMAVYRSLLEGEKVAALQGTTEFEIITALAYDYFSSEKVDVAIMEVGMGGLLDSTNVCQPILTGITTIGLDHVALLGDTLEAIAEQKAGIIKQGIPLVTGRITQEALTVIDPIAEAKNAPRLAYGKDYQVRHQESVVAGEIFDYTSSVRQGRFQTGLLGLHQIENAGMALALLDTYCQEVGRELASNDLVAQAMEETRWPGRLEVLPSEPLMILDGAHNPHAIKALLKTLQERFVDYHKEILFTCIKTKALEDMLDLLETVPDSQLTLTHFDDSRATDERALKETAKSRNLNYHSWQDFLEQKLTDKKEEKQTVRIVTGSLYFLSQVRAYLMERKNENGYTKDRNGCKNDY
ncbi:bifunctional folylpolyglutamate synthase/dihydrofolate synthase [Streptococcus sp. KHUD_018]